MTNKERLEQIKDAIAHELGLTDDYMDGTYLYHLTRSKSAFAVGTMTLDDFKEIDEELLDEIFNAIEPFFIEQAGRVQELEKQNQRYREALEFYADEKNHEREWDTFTDSGVEKSEVMKDSGEKARQALKGE